MLSTLGWPSMIKQFVFCCPQHLCNDISPTSIYRRKSCNSLRHTASPTASTDRNASFIRGTVATSFLEFREGEISHFVGISQFICENVYGFSGFYPNRWSRACSMAFLPIVPILLPSLIRLCRKILQV